MIKAVLFDMDGVLVEAKQWHYEAMNKALKVVDFHIPYEEHLVKYDGLPTQRKLEILTKERGLSELTHPFITRMKQKYTMDIIHLHCEPIRHHEYALSRLRADGYQLAVCSNSVRETVELVMEKTKLMPYLSFCLSNQDVVNSKPNPEIYILAMHKLGLKSRECLIVEDNVNGIEAARQSGAFVMNVNSVEDVNYEAVTSQIKIIEQRWHDKGCERTL